MRPDKVAEAFVEYAEQCNYHDSNEYHAATGSSENDPPEVALQGIDLEYDG